MKHTKTTKQKTRDGSGAYFNEPTRVVVCPSCQSEIILPVGKRTLPAHIMSGFIGYCDFGNAQFEVKNEKVVWLYLPDEE